MRKQAIKSSSLRIAVQKNYSLLLVKNHCLPLRLLQSRQSIWQLLMSVRPPSRHGVMWLALHGYRLVY